MKTGDWKANRGMEDQARKLRVFVLHKTGLKLHNTSCILMVQRCQDLDSVPVARSCLFSVDNVIVWEWVYYHENSPAFFMVMFLNARGFFTASVDLLSVCDQFILRRVYK